MLSLDIYMVILLPQNCTVEVHCLGILFPLGLVLREAVHINRINGIYQAICCSISLSLCFEGTNNSVPVFQLVLWNVIHFDEL